nr:cation:proton antiporter [endosymbiont 'TC1' of Trimyema compressum]
MLRRHGFEEVNSLVAIQLITPFLIYIAGEFLGLSSILTVVTAGIIHGIERDRLQQTTTKLQIVTNNMRSVLGYLLNGLVFVLLGFLLPSVYVGLYKSGEIPVWQVVTLIFIIMAFLFIIRFLWVFLLYRKFISPSCKYNRSHIDFFAGKHARSRYSFIAALGGIHGTITLATVLSLPFLLNDGTPLPFRNTIIFIATGVILLSFIMAIFLIPLFC